MWVLRRTEGEVVPDRRQTFWDSGEAVERFASPEDGRARYYPEDEDDLPARVLSVTDYEVVEAAGPFGSRARSRGWDRQRR